MCKKTFKRAATVIHFFFSNINPAFCLKTTGVTHIALSCALTRLRVAKPKDNALSWTIYKTCVGLA
jgi:hypothetical protein